MTKSINTGDIFHNIADISKYEILHHANVDCNLAHQIVYRSLDTGRIYARPIEEFKARFYKSSVSAMMDNIENICEKSQALVNRWDTMDWKDTMDWRDAKHTADYINELRAALKKLKETK